MSVQVQPRLLGIGVALVAFGFLSLAIALVGWEGSGLSTATPIGADIPADRAAPNFLMGLWPIVGGISLAAGAALIGIGMNRWRGRRAQAGDRPVNQSAPSR